MESAVTPSQGWQGRHWWAIPIWRGFGSRSVDHTGVPTPRSTQNSEVALPRVSGLVEPAAIGPLGGRSVVALGDFDDGAGANPGWYAVRSEGIEEGIRVDDAFGWVHAGGGDAPVEELA